MSDETKKVLEERATVYGDFNKGVELEACIVEGIKDHFYETHGYGMDPIHAMLLSKIVMKLVRLAVTPDHLDSWRDVSGYAELAYNYHQAHGGYDA